jgi:hypothetical protein
LLKVASWNVRIAPLPASGLDRAVFSSPYSEVYMHDLDITRHRPTTVVFLVDQSSSMHEPSSIRGSTKADVVQGVINGILQELIIRATRDEVMRYYQLAVVGYGGTLRPILAGTDPRRPFIWVDDLDALELPEHEAQYGGTSIRVPHFVDVVASGNTPMVAAFGIAEKLVQHAAKAYPESYPPTLIHITDGDSTDGDPTPIAQRIGRIATSNGGVLVFNVHISGMGGGSHFLPPNLDGIPDPLARMLFEISSPLPDAACAFAKSQLEIPIHPGTRGFAYNSDAAALAWFMKIGTPVRSGRLVPAPQHEVGTPPR